MTKTTWFLAAAAALLFACPPPPLTCNPDEEDCTDAGPPPDVCNSKEDALSDAQCALTLCAAADGGSKLDFLSVANDQDFYSVQLGTLNPRSLVHVIAGYGAPATPINLAVSVLKEDGVTGLVRKIDRHGTAAPKPVDIIFPYAESNTRLLVLLSDEGGTNMPKVDLRNKYFVTACVLDNPDVNEPNDTTTTTILLPGTPPTGQAQGAIATDDDLDNYSFDVPAGAQRRVIYLHLTMPVLEPQANLRLSYTLYEGAFNDPMRRPISEGQVMNEYIAVDLATARLARPGPYSVVVKGYRPPSVTTVIPGDLRSLYTLAITLYDDLDLQEGASGNDTVANPKVVPLGYGAFTTLTGRIGYVPDPDTYGVDLAADARAGVLYYRVRPAPGATGRFAPLAPVPDRQVRVATQVTVGATLVDKQNNCVLDPKICPKGYEGSLNFQSLVESLCNTPDPWCLWAERNEDVGTPTRPTWPNLRNLEGTVPIPAHPGGTLRYLVFVQDEGTNYADDRDYVLDLEYRADPDDTTRASLPNQTEAGAVSQNASFPTPATAGEVIGSVSHGYGRVLNNDQMRGEGVRANNDYDAVPTDFDRFDFALPAVAAPMDRTWALEWELSHDDAGSPPADLALEFGFCTVTGLADGGCAPIIRTGGYVSGKNQPWYAASGSSAADLTVLFTRTVNANSTVITAQPGGCFCMEPRVMAAGHYTVSVGAVDRNRHAPLNYRIRQSLAPYPQGYTGGDGGSTVCPLSTDAGMSCNFTRIPP